MVTAAGESIDDEDLDDDDDVQLIEEIDEMGEIEEIEEMGEIEEVEEIEELEEIEEVLLEEGEDSIEQILESEPSPQNQTEPEEVLPTEPIVQQQSEDREYIGMTNKCSVLIRIPKFFLIEHSRIHQLANIESIPGQVHLQPLP